MQPCSLNRLSNLVKSTGVRCSVSTIMEYVRYLQEYCLLISLDNYASKFTEKETVKKHYFVDNGLLHLFINNPDTLLLENLCAITLYKKYGSGIYYFNRNIEVDFYVPDEGLAVQACYRMSDESTLEREIKALVAINSLYPLKKGNDCDIRGRGSDGARWVENRDCACLEMGAKWCNQSITENNLRHTRGLSAYSGDTRLPIR